MSLSLSLGFCQGLSIVGFDLGRNPLTLDYSTPTETGVTSLNLVWKESLGQSIYVFAVALINSSLTIDRNCAVLFNYLQSN